MALKRFNSRNFKHMEVVEKTIEGKPATAIAKDLQMGARTVHSVLSTPEAQDLLNEAMQAIQARIVEKLPALVEQSLKTLLDAQTAFGADYPTRVNAAKAGLSAMIKLSEITAKSQT
jgi:hypothetical protein